MEPKTRKNRSGLTLIEVMVAITVVVVGIMGAMMYRYQSALNARIADVQVGAGRVGLLILEGWKGAAGAPGYNPSTEIGPEVLGSSDIVITSTGGNTYTVQLTGGTYTNYSVTLTRLDGATNDITGDENNDPGLVKLTVEATSGLRTVKLSDFVRN